MLDPSKPDPDPDILFFSPDIRIRFSIASQAVSVCLKLTLSSSLSTAVPLTF
ncbi:hypothetical protein F2Q69_00041984 [Brassica cretica]|uniref:Uncharacterized protein n=1 Tax=Brassica cretica TaxID=69181 RepID=A0A8S9NN40_BRACR|nr:hypothetical protein F2Q69_00041984 [Brassica cretica]